MSSLTISPGRSALPCRIQGQWLGWIAWLVHWLKTKFLVLEYERLKHRLCTTEERLDLYDRMLTRTKDGDSGFDISIELTEVRATGLKTHAELYVHSEAEDRSEESGIHSCLGFDC